MRDSAPGWIASTTYSERGYGFRNCTDWVAWRLESTGALPVSTRGLGDGGQWAARAAADPMPGRVVSETPSVGAAAVVVGGGHVAYVEAVHSDGTITVSEYNAAADGRYGTWTGRPTDRGFLRFVSFPKR
jgi:surface antigen